jgi:hypothetical protein
VRSVRRDEQIGPQELEPRPKREGILVLVQCLDDGAVVVWTLAHDVLKCSPLPLNGLQRYRTQPPTLPGIAEPEIIETTIDL